MSDPAARPTPEPAQSLLDPAFIRRLGRLRLLVRRRFAGAAGGARQSLRRGASVEFADHRAYTPGDDFRRIDWNAYARLEELVIRLFVAEEDVTVTLLLDASASMDFGSPRKLDVAKQLAASLGYLGLTGSERVGVQPFSATTLRPLPHSRGRARVGRLLRFLDGVQPSEETNLAATVEAFLARRPRPGLVIILSDLMDPGGYQRPIDRLLAARHEPVVFHVLDAEELEPTPGGDLVLVDQERATRVEVTLDKRALDAYRGRIRAFIDGAREHARKRGYDYVLVGDADFESGLIAYLREAPQRARR